METITGAWDVELGRWRLAMLAGGSPATTVYLRTYHVRQLGRDLGGGPWSVSTSQLIGWLGAQAWARNTRRSYTQSVRSFYTWGVQAGRTGRNPALGLPRVSQAPPRPRPAAEGDYQLALARAEPRVQLMLRLAGELGLRRGEVAQVHRADVVADLTGWSVIVHGKGNRERTVPMPDELAGQVLTASSGARGWAFPGATNGHLSADRIGKLVGRCLPAGVSMHQLRHRFASRAYQVDTDLATVQQLLGHSSPATTMAYVQLPAAAARRTVLAIAS